MHLGRLSRSTWPTSGQNIADFVIPRLIGRSGRATRVTPSDWTHIPDMTSVTSWLACVTCVAFKMSLSTKCVSQLGTAGREAGGKWRI